MVKRLLSLLCCGWVGGCALLAAPGEARPGAWAQRVVLEGVPNLHQVSSNLYRSAQPTARGMRALETRGVATVISLRSFHTDRDELRGTGLGYEHLYMKAWHPEVEEVVRFLRIATDPKRTPVLVHCQHGADRTGAMCAAYRVAVQGWTKEAAIREMREGGFGFHTVWRNLPRWIKDLDVESIRQRTGLGPRTQPGAADRAPGAPPPPPPIAPPDR